MHDMGIYQHPILRLVVELVGYLSNVVMEHEIGNFEDVDMKNVEFVDNRLMVGYDNEYYVDIFLFHNLLY